MKIIICIASFLLTFSVVALSQSVINFPAGTSLTLPQGTSMSADNIFINGTFTGGGTINGSTAYVLNLTAVIEGFYNPLTDIMVSDTVNVYLRNFSSPYALVDSVKAILNSSGTGTFIFPNAVNGVYYYLVIKHRNSIETWSTNSENYFTTNSFVYNFSTAITQAYGNNMIQVNTSPGKFAIYSGDVNQDGFVNLTDITLVYNGALNFINGYVSADVNGDNIVDLTDLLITYNNSVNFVEIKRP